MRPDHPPCAQCAGEPERWLAAPGWEGFYAVSDYGRVRSFHGVGRLLTLRPDSDGYPGVVLSGRGRLVPRKVHQLVLVAFVGPVPAGQECRHWDDEPDHCHAGNLLYGTRSDNHDDRRRNHAGRRNAYRIPLRWMD